MDFGFGSLSASGVLYQ